MQNHHPENVQPEPTRRSLNDIDLLNMLNSAQRSHKSSIFTDPKVYDSIYKEISEIKLQLERKSERKDLFELRNCIHKEISGKMTIKQTERIVEKFESQVFEKMNETYKLLQKIENNLKNNMDSKFLDMKEELL